MGNSQLIIAVGLRGARRKVPWDGRSRGRDIASSALCPCVCPEMEKGWLLGKEPIISVALEEDSVKGITLCQSFVSVAWLVMPIHWIRDEHTYIIEYVR